jgi:hypothetical protein
VSIETDFRATLAAHPPLVALVGLRIAANAVPKGSAFPVVVFTSNHTPTVGLDGTLLANQCTLAVQCWGDTAAQADQVADAVSAALAAAPRDAGATVIDRRTSFDPDIGKDATELAVEWWA